jgi:hypothetical protein
MTGDTYLRQTSPIQPLPSDPSQFVMKEYIPLLDFARQLGSARTDGFEIDFCWPNGKVRIFFERCGRIREDADVFSGSA